MPACCACCRITYEWWNVPLVPKLPAGGGQVQQHAAAGLQQLTELHSRRMPMQDWQQLQAAAGPDLPGRVAAGGQGRARRGEGRCPPAPACRHPEAQPGQAAVPAALNNEETAAMQATSYAASATRLLPSASGLPPAGTSARRCLTQQAGASSIASIVAAMTLTVAAMLTRRRRRAAVKKRAGDQLILVKHVDRTASPP